MTPLAWTVSDVFSHVLHVDCSICYDSQPRIPSSFPISPLFQISFSLKHTPEPCYPSVVPGPAASTSPGRSLRDAPSLTQVRDCGRVGQNGSSGGRENESDSGSNLQVEPTGFPDQLSVNSEGWNLSKGKDGVASEITLLWVSERGFRGCLTKPPLCSEHNISLP